MQVMHSEHYDAVVVHYCLHDHHLSDAFGRKTSPVEERDTFPLLLRLKLKICLGPYEQNNVYVSD